MGALLHGWWDAFFYVPLLNVLIWLYNGPAGQNLGAAIILLTVGVRLLLLPFSFFSERSKHIYEKVEKKIVGIEREHKDDPELQKERIRELLREHGVSPWSRAWLLLLQLLVLVVLYQVFMGSIRTNRFDQLYPWVEHPDLVFTNFLWWNLSARSWFWSLLVGAWLYLEITADQRKHRENLTRSDLFYRVGFPAFSAVVLLLLPMMKSLFILTSLAFSYIIGSTRRVLFQVKTEDDD